MLTGSSERTQRTDSCRVATWCWISALFHCSIGQKDFDVSGHDVEINNKRKLVVSHMWQETGEVKAAKIEKETLESKGWALFKKV